MKRKGTKNCVKPNKMNTAQKTSKVKKLIETLESSVPMLEKKKYCLFCYKLVNYNTNQTSRETNNDKDNEKVQTCDKFYKYLLRNSSKHADNLQTEGKVETDKQSSFSFKQIQQICLGACNDCFYVINMCCTVFKEIEDLQSSLKTSLQTLRNVMHEAGKVTARMKLFRESFALPTSHKKKGKRKCDKNDPRSLQEVMAFRKSIFETCLLNPADINRSVKNEKPDIQLSPESKPSEHDKLPDNEIGKQSLTADPSKPITRSTSATCTTNDENVESVEDKNNEDMDIEILTVIKTEVEEMTLDLHPSFYTEDNMMNDADENSISMLMAMTEGRSESIFRFKCIKCDKTFSTEDQLISHASSHFYTEVNIQTSDDSPSKNCLISNYPIINYGNESTVMPEESNENDELLACLFCSFTTAQITALVEHETTVHIPTLIGHSEPENNDGKEARCPRCLNFFNLKNKKWKLRRHYINCHMEKKCSVKCENCDLIFKGCNMKEANVRLNLHRQRIHSTDRTKKFDCKMCDKKFYYGYNLSNHMRSQHKGGFKCSICQVKLSSKHSVIRHMKKIHQQNG